MFLPFFNGIFLADSGLDAKWWVLNVECLARCVWNMIFGLFKFSKMNEPKGQTEVLAQTKLILVASTGLGQILRRVL